MSKKYKPIEDVIHQNTRKPSSAPQPYIEGRFEYDFTAFPNELVFSHIKGIATFSQVITLMNTGRKDITINAIEIVGPFKIVGDTPKTIPLRYPTSLLIQYDDSKGDIETYGGLYISCKDSVGKAFIKLSVQSSDVDVSTENIVAVTPQSFTDKQKQTARENIDAVGRNEKIVRYTEQRLTEAEQAQARANLGITGTGGGGGGGGTTPGKHPNSSVFEIYRGINMDTWVVWPPAESWNNPSVLLPYPEWRKHLKHEDFYHLKNKGFDFVRMTVDPAPFLAPQSAPLYSQLLDSVMQGYRDLRYAGLKVIIDLHAINEGRDINPGVPQILDNGPMWEKYIKLIEDFATRLKNEDPRAVAFETMNEPNQGNAPNPEQVWLTRQQRMYNSFRAIAKDIPIILTSGTDSSAQSLSRVNPNQYGGGNDKNIIWTFHSYAPFLLTHQGALWSGEVTRYVTGIPYPIYSESKEAYERSLEAIRQNIRDNAPEADVNRLISYVNEEMAKLDTPEKVYNAIAAPFKTITTWANQYNISPSNIFLGEFGIIRQEYGNSHVVKAEQRAEFYRDVVSISEDHGIPWAMWSYGGAFGIVEEFEWRKAETNTIDMVDRLPKLPIMTI